MLVTAGTITDVRFYPAISPDGESNFPWTKIARSDGPFSFQAHHTTAGKKLGPPSCSLSRCSGWQSLVPPPSHPL